MGAVIVKKKPVSIGFNYDKTHPKYADGKTSYSIHAEVSAILHARCDIRDSTLYVYRSHADGSPANARPCTNCMKVIVEAGIKRVIFTESDYPYFGVIDT